MSTFSQFLGGGDPVGSLTLGIGLPSDKYIPCDGRTVTRATWPKLSALFPLGRFIRTTRTLPEAPALQSSTVSPTYFVTTGGNTAGTNKIQYSTDGAIWSNTGVSHANGIPSAIIWAGNRFVALFSDSVNAIVTSGDNPGSTWINTTNSLQSYTNPNLVAYSPGLNKVLALPNSSGAGRTLAGGSTAWVDAGATPAMASGLVWTGSVFIATQTSAGLLMQSNDGASWAYSGALSTTTMNAPIASNGSGTVVVIHGGMIHVSTDHGANWRIANTAGKRFDGILSYSGGLFLLLTSLAPNFVHLHASSDGLNWFIVSREGATNIGSVAKKGATTVAVSVYATAYSYTESATEFIIPALPAHSLSSAVTNTAATSIGNYYIKAA